MGILGIPDRWKAPLALTTSVATAAALSVVVISGPASAAGQPAINLDQCRNGSATAPADCIDSGGNTGWVNGNVGASQAHMVEGYSTPFRAVMTNLPTDGSIVTLVLGYDIKHSGKNAYDFLTGVDNLDPHTAFGHAAEAVDPTSGVSGVSATTDVEQLPAPANAPTKVTLTRDALIAAGKGNMKIFGGEFTDTIGLTTSGNLSLAQSEARITVKFKATSPTAVLAWGGHIAKCEDWPKDLDGTCSSAAGISGSPYHMRLIGWNLTNLGNTDRSMAAAVVVSPGSLTLAKTLTGPAPSGYTGPFTLHYACTDGKNGDVQVSAGSSVTIPGITAGASCTVTEPNLPTPPGGYAFGTPTFDPTNGTVTILAGSTVTVTTKNTISQLQYDTSFTIKKTVVGGPSSGYDPSYSIGWVCKVGSTTIDSGTVSLKAGATSASIPVDLFDDNGNLQTVTCSVSEPTFPTKPAGYSFDPVEYPSGSSHTFDASDPASFTFAFGVKNTLVRDLGSLKVTKKVTNDDDADLSSVEFSVNVTCTYGDVETENKDLTLSDGESATLTGIPTLSECTVTEGALPPVKGFTWDAADITPNGGVVTIDDATTVFEVNVQNKLTRDRGSLTIIKELDNPDEADVPATFDVTYTCGTADPVTVAVTPGTTGKVIDGIPTGTECTIEEVAPAPIDGYTWADPTYDPASVTIDDETSTFTVMVKNSITRDKGYLKISKVFDPTASGWSDGFTISYVCTLGADTLADDSVTLYGGDASEPIGPFPTGTECTVTEVAPTDPAGLWGFKDPILVDESGDTEDGTVTIDVDGETYEVVVTNEAYRLKGSLTVTKEVVNDQGATLDGITYPINVTCTFGSDETKNVDFDLTGDGDSKTVSDIPTGSECTVTEGTPSGTPTGYSWQTPEITPDGGVVTISDTTTAFAVTVKNTITRDTGKLIVKKITRPAGGGPFQFETTGEDYTEGYALSDGESNERTLNTGTYTVTEVFDPAWIFVGATCDNGVTADENGFLSVDLGKGQTVTCTYENSGPGTTRTQGFWSTHLALAEAAWFGTDGGPLVGGHDFGAGVAGSVLGTEICGANKSVDTVGQLMGGFWSSVATLSDGKKKRSALDKSRMILLQQLLAAELNYAAFGTTPVGGTATLEGWETAFCGTNQTAIKAAAGQAAAFNEAGDSGAFTPGMAANAPGAKAIADRPFWDKPTGV